MPAQHCGWSHDEEQDGEDRAIGLGEARSGHLALQHEDLMAQRQDLGVARIARRNQQTEPLNDQTNHGRQRTPTSALRSHRNEPATEPADQGRRVYGRLTRGSRNLRRDADAVMHLRVASVRCNAFC
jgi:hypothetical protein